MNGSTFYAINSAGRQKLPVDNIMDAYEYVTYYSEYYKNNPPSRIVEENKITFYYPEDFE